MSGSDAKVIDFAQARVNQIADAIRMLAEQIQFTNTHVERLHRELGEVRTDVKRELGSMRGEISSMRGEINGRFRDMDVRFDALHQAVGELGGEVILQANQIINAQRAAMRATMRLDDLERLERPPETP
jgi:outer membrane murein-binding lipoprotein Lpp